MAVTHVQRVEVPRAGEGLAPRPSGAPRVSPRGPDADVWVSMDSRNDPTRLGLGAPDAPGEAPRSRILEVLGSDRVVKVRGVGIPGARLLWVNFELARALGFPVPPGNVLTEELERALLDALAFRVLGPGEEVGDRPCIDFYADRYGGSHIGLNRGSGRSGFLEKWNLSIKGIGRTPLACERYEDDFQHAHGGASVREAMREAVWGEVDHHLFPAGSTRVLALIDTGDVTHWPDGGQERRVLVVRAGLQGRPAHVLEGCSGGPFSVWVFRRLAAAMGVLVKELRKGGGAPIDNLVKTQRRIDENHGAVAAQAFRWRKVSGGLSTSNMDLSGAFLDLALESTQPRTGDVYTLVHGSSFLEEPRVRAAELDGAYREIWTSVEEPPPGVSLGPLDVWGDVEQAFARELALQLAEAAGLKPALVERVMKATRRHGPALLREFAEAAYALAELPGDGSRDAQAGSVERAARVDLFGLLQALPALYFRAPPRKGAPLAARAAALAPEVIAQLCPLYGADPEKRAKDEAEVAAGAHRLALAYLKLMRLACSPEVYDGLYRDEAELESSVRARAELENRPLDALYYAELDREILAAQAAYERTGDPREIGSRIDAVVARSYRSFDALLTQGEARRAPDGALELERRVIHGVEYCVRAGEDGTRSLRVRVPLLAEGDGLRLGAGDDRLPFTPGEAGGVGFKYTLDGWSSSGVARPVLQQEEDGCSLVFDLPLSSTPFAASLEGIFQLPGGGYSHDQGQNFLGYAFAVPDSAEARAIGERVGAGASAPGASLRTVPVAPGEVSRVG